MAKLYNQLSIMEFRDLKKQYLALQPEMDQALLGAARESHFIMGPQVAALEEKLAAYVGVKHCMTCANGTDALTLALKAWGIGKGDAVFVPDFTFFSSAEVVSLEGATPVFVDIEEATFNMDPQDLERAVRETLAAGLLKPRVIVAVDLFGQPADYPRIREIADRYGLLILEDGAQGFGGSIEIPDQVGDDWRNTVMPGSTSIMPGSTSVMSGSTSVMPGSTGHLRRACSFGDISTTSFFPAKPLGCYGDGGAVFTDNDEWAALIRSYRIHGKGTDKYDNVRIGLNSRLDTLQAVVLLVKLKAFEEYELDAVNAAAGRYTELLNQVVMAGSDRPSQLEIPGQAGDDPVLLTPVVRGGFRSSWAQYTVRLRDCAERDAVQAALKAEGIPAMIYYPRPMHAQTAFTAQIPDQVGDDVRNIVMPGSTGHLPNSNFCPVATRLCSQVLSLPLHPYITDSEMQSVADAIRRALNR